MNRRSEIRGLSRKIKVKPLLRLIEDRQALLDAPDQDCRRSVADFQTKNLGQTNVISSHQKLSEWWE